YNPLPDRTRYRPRGEEAEHSGAVPDPKAKNNSIFDKMFRRGNGMCIGGGNSSKSPVGPSDLSETKLVGSSRSTNIDNHPTPVPRQNQPVPKPRTIMSGNVGLNHSPQPRNTHSQPEHQHQPRNDLDIQRHKGARSLRGDVEVSRFGSDRTLDSDCSSIGGRRPSADTISTYLSDDHNQHSRSHNIDESDAVGGPPVDQFFGLESDDESMDDDVFDVDEEVCKVMRGAVGNTSPVRSPSPPHGAQGLFHHGQHPGRARSQK
ncbi:hypothetical protein SK128_013907, partial [Halocaridina rubra]